MVYNKVAIYKYKANNIEQYTASTRQATHKYRHKNIELTREKDRLRKTPFMMEWKMFRHIELFN